MTPETERHLLSPREDAVLRHAASGMTDQQIANALEIRVSTVTTYWTRIRSKVGRLSRAELIAMTIRQRSLEIVNALRDEISVLRDRLAQEEARGNAAHAELEALQSRLRLAAKAVDIEGDVAAPQGHRR